MENLKVKSFGPIHSAEVNFGDLTLLVGPQASGKSIFLQLLKLIIDKNNIKHIFKQYSYEWEKDADKMLNLYFGEGMYKIWKQDTEISYNDKSFTKDLLLKTKIGSEISKEKLFYIPAQRILSVADGRPKNFMEFDYSTPYVLRHFSETLRQLFQNNMDSGRDVFPAKNQLKKTLRDSFNDSIFHNGKIVIDDKTGQKKIKMEINDMSVPFITWSAGQKEFMPLLLGFYWLCPSSKAKRKAGFKYVVIEEPEMGLHPQAIKSVILQILDLISRDYKVIISTHSPVLLEFAWAFNLLKNSKIGEEALFELFSIERNSSTNNIFKKLLSTKTINTYYFARENESVNVVDITSLDAGSENNAISEWGGISEFSSRAVDIVSKYYSEDEDLENA